MSQLQQSLDCRGPLTSWDWSEKHARLGFPGRSRWNIVCMQPSHCKWWLAGVCLHSRSGTHHTRTCGLTAVYLTNRSAADWRLQTTSGSSQCESSGRPAWDWCHLFTFLLTQDWSNIEKRFWLIFPRFIRPLFTSPFYRTSLKKLKTKSNRAFLSDGVLESV